MINDKSDRFFSSSHEEETRDRVIQLSLRQSFDVIKERINCIHK